MFLALFIVKHRYKLDLLLREINFASNSTLILQKGIELLKVILKSVLVLEYTLILVPITLVKSGPLTTINNIIVQLVKVHTLSNIHS